LLPDLQIHTEQVFQLIDSMFSEAQLPVIENDRNTRFNKLNANFDK